ncbi:type II secretion system protein GspM [Acinetobacter sichuanensis]|uniref:Type II secretion system protein GspM n=1 Tax=Acinetobacter sichuanensis TaxID=2136183 RepID=A0A371YSK1_9GAMM|nr:MULTISPECIES: type II secretion system protein GspM [Acinetobacter]MDM1247418.1 type II secretion system protein M [Acinetobacter sp. R933-2]MDQ9020204.1 type II secretion system protein GspM [Acinetobacter sichuanensis]RFC84447.1 type II secretion system protein M [Acinetobacter sichuanensis]
MKAIDNIQHRFDAWAEKITDQLDKMSMRERVMVIFTTIFVVVAIVGSALWSTHKAAENQQKRLNELKDLVVWMQSNVVTMKPADDLSLTVPDKIQRVAQQQGLSIASQQVGEQFQIVGQHENYAVLANFLTQIAQMGVSIEKMELIKVDSQIKLTATVH